MSYFVAFLISLVCWVFWGNWDSTGLRGDEANLALRLSMGSFFVLGLIQIIVKASISSRRTILDPYGIRLSEIPVLRISDTLLVEDQLRASGINHPSEEKATKNEKAATDLEAKRLSDILDD